MYEPSNESVDWLPSPIGPITAMLDTEVPRPWLVEVAEAGLIGRRLFAFLSSTIPSSAARSASATCAAEFTFANPAGEVIGVSNNPSANFSCRPA